MEHFKKATHLAFDRPPSRAWLFAQAVLGKPIPRIIGPEARARAEREQLTRLAEISPRHATKLRKLEVADAEARHERDKLTWAAAISTTTEEQLRSAQFKEAEEREAWRRAESIDRGNNASFTEWESADHPRHSKGTRQGGQFAPKNGGGLLNHVARRNQDFAELSGVVTPSMIQSSRLAADLQAAGRLPAEIAAAAKAGLKTGAKAVVNGSATAVKDVATLGLKPGQLELIGVTDGDRQRGYNTAVSISTASGQVLIAVGSGGLTAALSKGGTVARNASGLLVAYDAAGNAVGVVQGAYDVSQNGLNLENGAKIAGSSLGLAINAKATRGLSRATAAELQKVEEYIAKCPRRNTPTKTAANRYEIAHTGPYNYVVAVRDAEFAIDGYRGTTILEAKHTGDIKSSPYVPGSTCYEPVRAKILNEARDELKRVRTIIRSSETPFKSIEIITNTPESKALFETLLKESGVPGTVRLEI